MIAVVKQTASALAVSLALSTLLVACGGGSDDATTASSVAASVSDPTQFFNRVATFAVCEQIGSSCEAGVATAAEIVAASTDGMTLIYTNSPKDEVGFVDITDPSAPVALGALAMGGEPTSITVRGEHALIAVNTSPSYIAPSGKLVVVNIATRAVVHEIALGGQPDSIAISKDGKYVAVVIENERDEELPTPSGKGRPAQLPGGKLTIVDAVGAPNTWQTRDVALTNLAMLYPTDPEPEYVSINDNNVAVVTLQENNHLVLVDLATGKVTRDFTAGSVSLAQIDLTDAPRPNQVSLTESLDDRLREPDGVTWVSTSQFVTANEGDLDGGSRGFTMFNTDGSVAYDAGNTMEHLMARIGHTNDKRSDAKGNEPENVATGRFDRTDYLFVASERSSVLVVYDLSKANAPSFKQVLPSAQAPEGVLTIPSRNLVITASEETAPDPGKPSVFAALNIYQYQKAAPKYPTLESVNRADGTPIPWSALSGLAAAPTGSLMYAVDDAFFRGNRIFEIDTSVKPAKLQREIHITDPNGKIANLAATLPAGPDITVFDANDLNALVNADGTVNIDPEGIAIASNGGFWIASEGYNGTAKDPNITSANLIFKVSATGIIEDIIQLPTGVNAKQTGNGYEGIAEADGKLVVAFQRAWTGDSHPRIGVYDLTTKTWSFLFYPLDLPTSPNGGWVGLSEIMALGSNRFAVIERDNQAGPDATVKKIYRIDLTKVDGNGVLTKTLVRDLLPDLRATKGHVLEKIEGLARLSNGDVYIVNDNDGVDLGSGETQLINLGKILN